MNKVTNIMPVVIESAGLTLCAAGIYEIAGLGVSLVLAGLSCLAIGYAIGKGA